MNKDYLTNSEIREISGVHGILKEDIDEAIKLHGLSLFNSKKLDDLIYRLLVDVYVEAFNSGLSQGSDKERAIWCDSNIVSKNTMTFGELLKVMKKKTKIDLRCNNNSLFLDFAGNFLRYKAGYLEAKIKSIRPSCDEIANIVVVIEEFKEVTSSEEKPVNTNE